MASFETEEKPVWDPVAQIYVGGKVPGSDDATVRSMIRNAGVLRVFGYGSLCWNPGKPGESALADPKVTLTTGHVKGYRRAWAQKSTDHRGLPSFPGIVCTLLQEKEFATFRQTSGLESVTEGVIYSVPLGLADECLSELDFREKGGYAREIVTVAEDETGTTVEALLYRGTPDNPAFWPRALRDLPFAAAVMSVSVGPSGNNMAYLENLDKFLLNASYSTKSCDDTIQLSTWAIDLQNSDAQLHFLSGCGSNQHNQLMLESESNVANLENNGEDAHEMKEIVLAASSTQSAFDPVVSLYAGGGHSGVLTKEGYLFLFGWNEYGQLGRQSDPVRDKNVSLPFVPPLERRVSFVALGFSHSLIIERDTGLLLAFGENSKGQVDGNPSDASVRGLATPNVLVGEQVVYASAGVFHSAAITRDRADLVTWGQEKFMVNESGRWRPHDGSKLVKVACGRKHTAVIDDSGRLWTFGDNKYGQIGHTAEKSGPALVDISMPCVEVHCGWSHTIVLCQQVDNGSLVAYGFGRNDKGQLGIGTTEHQFLPVRLFPGIAIKSMSCGSESTVVVDESGSVLSCGWNEHGNLGNGSTVDGSILVEVEGSPITVTPEYGGDTEIQVAAGGAHLLAMRTV